MFRSPTTSTCSATPLMQCITQCCHAHRHQACHTRLPLLSLPSNSACSNMPIIHNARQHWHMQSASLPLSSLSYSGYAAALVNNRHLQQQANDGIHLGSCRSDPLSIASYSDHIRSSQACHTHLPAMLQRSGNQQPAPAVTCRKHIASHSMAYTLSTSACADKLGLLLGST